MLVQLYLIRSDLHFSYNEQCMLYAKNNFASLLFGSIHLSSFSIVVNTFFLAIFQGPSFDSYFFPGQTKLQMASDWFRGERGWWVGWWVGWYWGETRSWLRLWDRAVWHEGGCGLQQRRQGRPFSLGCGQGELCGSQRQEAYEQVQVWCRRHL